MSVVEYVKGVKGELRHVSWPTRSQTVVFTVLVIAVSIFVAAYLGLFDLLFSRALGEYIGVEIGSPQVEMNDDTKDVENVGVQATDSDGNPVTSDQLQIETVPLETTNQ